MAGMARGIFVHGAAAGMARGIFVPGAVVIVHRSLGSITLLLC